jgi:hypothetical protein
MNYIPIPFEVTNMKPNLSIRNRKEVNVYDTTNSRLVEHWQTDAPALTNARRDIEQTERWQDMNPTPSRLYRENLNQSQPFVVPTPNSAEVRKSDQLNQNITNTLLQIQELGYKVQMAKTIHQKKELNSELLIKQQLYQTLLQQQKQGNVDTLAQNPYFNKFDVAGDSRNVVRELRSAVSEDIVDRGVRESQKLLQRELENRWLPPNYAEQQGIDVLSMMRPSMNR